MVNDVDILPDKKPEHLLSTFGLGEMAVMGLWTILTVKGRVVTEIIPNTGNIV